MKVILIFMLGRSTDQITRRISRFSLSFSLSLSHLSLSLVSISPSLFALSLLSSSLSSFRVPALSIKIYLACIGERKNIDPRASKKRSRNRGDLWGKYNAFFFTACCCFPQQIKASLTEADLFCLQWAIMCMTLDSLFFPDKRRTQIKQKKIKGLLFCLATPSLSFSLISLSLSLNETSTLAVMQSVIDQSSVGFPLAALSSF